MDHVIVPQLARFEQDWHFSHGVVTNGLAFLSGVTGTRTDGTVDDDPTTQFEQTFRHLDQYLTAAGAGFDDLIELTTYHVDLHRHLDEFIVVKDRHVTAPFPAWSCIGVNALITPGALVEIRAVAESRRAR